AGALRHGLPADHGLAIVEALARSRVSHGRGFWALLRRAGDVASPDPRDRSFRPRVRRGEPRAPSAMTLPNLITLARFCLVPAVIGCITSSACHLAFWLFLAAGVSDGIDGFIAKRFDLRSELGAILDPLADKALLVSLFVTLAIVGALPAWLVILV